MSSDVLWLAGLLAVVASGYRLVRARRNLTPGAVYLCLAVSFVGTSAAVIAPGTLSLTLALEPFPNATRLVGNGLAMIAGFCLHGLVNHLVMTPQQARSAMRRQAVIVAACWAVMTLLLATASVSSNADFVAADGHNLHVVGYVLIFCGYIAAAATQFTRLIGRYIRLSERPWLRRGLRVVQVGAVFGIGWGIEKSASAIFVYLTGTRLLAETLASAVLSGTCVALVAIGSSMPTWGPALAAPVRWTARYHAYHALRPLWCALTEAMPEITQTVEDTAGQGGSIEWRLTRRIVEIQDGLLALAPYRRADTEGQRIHRRHRPATAAEAEAAGILAALRARRAGAPIPLEPPKPPEQRRGLDAETAWLKQVARAYRHIAGVADYPAAREEPSEQH